MFFHGGPRELVVVAVAFVALGVIDQVGDVVDLIVGCNATPSKGVFVFTWCSKLGEPKCNFFIAN